MGGWADYLISAVAYNQSRQAVSLRRHRDTGDGIGPGELVDRTPVVSGIVAGTTYATIYGTLSGWRMGERIRASHVDGHFCLRIDDNKVIHDYLGPISELESDVPVQDAPKADDRPRVEPQAMSDSDVELLRDMGAQQTRSIKTAPEPTVDVRPSTPATKPAAKPNKAELAQYEKEYLQRLNISDRTTPQSAPTPAGSPHGTMPKGYVIPDPKPEPAPEPKIPRGTMPKGYVESKPEPAPEHDKKPESTPKPKPTQPKIPHGTMPKGYVVPDPKPEPTPKEHKKPESTPKPKPTQPKISRGTLPKGHGKQERSTPEKPPKTEKVKDHSHQLSEMKAQLDSIKKAAGLGATKIQAYCAKCKARRDIRDPVQSKTKVGKPAIRGTCRKCGSKMYKAGTLPS